MRSLSIMDTTLRDAHQSLWATRMQTGDMLPILDKMDQVGYWAMEAWGGATFDTCLRFLDEDPWERLRAVKSHLKNTPISMLSRGQNLVGYKHYSKDIVSRFLKAAKRNGVYVFRIFDALNDIRNVVDSAEAVKECGGYLEGAISYTMSPVHTMDSYVEYAQKWKDLGADSICIKDMAGMLTPYRTERLVTALREEIGLPIHLHCHYVGGMAPTNYIKAAEAGVSIVDTASAPLAFGNSQPAVEMIVSALKESGYDTGFDLDLLFEIADYWEEVRKRNHYKRGVTELSHMKVYSHQVPGGMMSNLVSQLETQNAADRLPEVLDEIPKVRAEVGYPPLVTPMSQIVGTQAVLNVLTGKRWSVVSSEMKDYLMGYYGKAPGPLDMNIVHKVLGDAKPLDPDVSPCSLETKSYEEYAEEIGDLARSEEDVLTYALFPETARTFLSKHRSSEKTPFLMEEESSGTKEEDYVDINQIKELIRAVEDSDIGELTIEEAGMKVTVRAQGEAAAVVPMAAMQPAAAEAAAPAAEAADAPTEEGAGEGERPDNWIAVTSPMVGTFYAAPSPGADPFVKEGDEVCAGQSLCIVEAMKLMNEVPAEQVGIIREICVEDAQPVEYGTVLMYLEPTSDGE